MLFVSLVLATKDWTFQRNGSKNFRPARRGIADKQSLPLLAVNFYRQLSKRATLGNAMQKARTHQQKPLPNDWSSVSLVLFGAPSCLYLERGEFIGPQKVCIPHPVERSKRCIFQEFPSRYSVGNARLINRYWIEHANLCSREIDICHCPYNGEDAPSTA
jgi:hypothetical protein